MANRLALAPPMMEYVSGSLSGSIAFTVRTVVVPEATLAVFGEAVGRADEGRWVPPAALGAICTTEKRLGTTFMFRMVLFAMEPPALRVAPVPNSVDSVGLSFEPSGLLSSAGSPFASPVGLALSSAIARL